MYLVSYPQFFSKEDFIPPPPKAKIIGLKIFCTCKNVGPKNSFPKLGRWTWGTVPDIQCHPMLLWSWNKPEFLGGDHHPTSNGVHRPRSNVTQCCFYHETNHLDPNFFCPDWVRLTSTYVTYRKLYVTHHITCYTSQIWWILWIAKMDTFTA